MKGRIARTRRNGLSTIEVVAATAIGLTMGFGLLVLVRSVSQRFLDICSLIVGWPLL